MTIDKSILNERIKCLIQSHQEGRHLVIFSREAHKWISKSLSFSPFEKSILKRLGDEYTQTGDLPSIARYFINVVDSNIGVERINCKEIALSVRYRHFSEILLRPILMAEDIIYDIEIYKLIFAENSNRPGGHGVSYDPAHGGGSRSSAATKVYTDMHRIVCTAFDTDKKAPMHAPEKLQEFVDELSEIDWPLLFSVPLPCAEIENIVPIELYCQFLSRENKSTIEALLMIEENEAKIKASYKDRFWLFFDVKKGFNSKNDMNAVDNDSKTWLGKKVEIIMKGSEDLVISGFGRTAIKTLLEEDLFATELKRATKKSSWKETFLPAVEAIYWVIIAPPPRFVC